MCEITNSTREQIASAWPEVTYKGQPLFQRYLDIIPEMAKKVGCDNQECYLGYVPSDDAFIIGFDAWPEEEYDDEYDEYVYQSCDNVFKFKLDNPNAAEVLHVGERMFYSGPYRSLQSSQPGLLDIRLD